MFRKLIEPLYVPGDTVVVTSGVSLLDGETGMQGRVLNMENTGSADRGIDSLGG